MPKRSRLKYSHILPITRRVGGETYTFRSKWEYNIAKWLQMRLERKRISKWEFEPKPFSLVRPNGQRVPYLPDFRLTDKTGVYYLEVKGRMDDESAEKIKLFREQQGRLDLIDSQKYLQIKAVFGGKLKF